MDKKPGDYIMFGSEAAVRALATRSLQREGAFVVPLLKPGMRVLDCGCGPGSITLDIARRVSPGEVVGIDFDANQIPFAQQLAVERGVGNVRYQVADAQALPFQDETFDLVFSHALVEHLPDPLRAAREMKRVLRPGGIVALRAPDHPADIRAPRIPTLDKADALYLELLRRNGANPEAGRIQPRWGGSDRRSTGGLGLASSW